MQINKTRITNLDRYLSFMPKGTRFRVSVSAESNAARPDRIGFPRDCIPGTAVLPKSSGPVSRYNAEGKFVRRSDLPKESRFIRTVIWRWKQWRGKDHEEKEDYRDIYRDCYPRELIPPPSIELSLIEIDGERCVVSPELEYSASNEGTNLHVINLMLELFGSCEILRADLTRISAPVITKVNWRFLPTGEYPWAKLKTHISHALTKSSDDVQRIIWNRMETLKAYGPSQIYVGQGGFNDYLAYVFNERRLVVLESIRKDNAVYVFGLNWENISKFSKAEILNSKLQTARIVHSKGWKSQIAQLLGRSAGA